MHQTSSPNSSRPSTSENCADCGRPVEWLEYGGRRIRLACQCVRDQYDQRVQSLTDDRITIALRNAGLETGLYKQMTLDRWRDIGVERRIMDYIRNVRLDSKNWLYLWGSYGLGKTHLAVAGARQIAYDRDWGPGLIRWAEYCSKIQQSWTDGSVRGDWRMARSCRILVVDDLDKKDATRWSLGQLFELIDYRYTAQAPTIFTANRPIKQLAERWMSADPDATQAIISRVVGQLYAAVQFKGTDYRLSRGGK